MNRIKRVRCSAATVQRLGARPGTGKSSSDRRPLLAGLALPLAGTGAGRRLAEYARANHPGLPFSDFLAWGMAASIAGALTGTLLFRGFLPGAVFAVAAPLLVERAFLHVHGRRNTRMERQLPEALALQAAALRAGHSLTRSLRVLTDKLGPPLHEELHTTVAEIDLGAPPDEALGRLAARSSSKDVELWVTAMLVHRQTGGSLSTVLDSLAAKVSERIQLRGEIKALTAQGRLSGLVVAVAPLGFLMLLSWGSPEQMRILYSTPRGWAILAGGLVLNGLGLVWIRWILRIRP